MTRTNLARLHRDGSVDLSFGNAGGGPDGPVSVILTEPSGAIWIGGNFTAVGGVLRRSVARLYGSGKIYRELLRPHVEQSRFSASIQTLAGRRNTLERSDSIVSPVWSAVATVDGDGSLKTVDAPRTGSSGQFYRLRVE